MVAAAIAGSAVAGIAGSAISSSASAGAAKSAAKTQAQTAATESAQQLNLGWDAYNADVANAGTAAAQLDPYAAEGQTALGTLNNNLGYLTTPFTPTAAQLEQTPGYQFTLQQGLLSTQNAAAAQGLGVSGAALNAASAYSTGLAQNTYAQDASIYQTNQQQIGNLLTGMVANGQNAATSQAQVLQTGQTNASNALTGQSNASAGTALTGAQAVAAGDIGAANATSGAISSATNSISQAALLAALMGNNTGAFGGGGGLKGTEGQV